MYVIQGLPATIGKAGIIVMARGHNQQPARLNFLINYHTIHDLELQCIIFNTIFNSQKFAIIVSNLIFIFSVIFSKNRSRQNISTKSHDCKLQIFQSGLTIKIARITIVMMCIQNARKKKNFNNTKLPLKETLYLSQQMEISKTSIKYIY